MNKLLFYANTKCIQRLYKYYISLQFISDKGLIYNNKFLYLPYYDKYIYTIYVVYRGKDRIYQQLERKNKTISYSNRKLLQVSYYYNERLETHIYMDNIYIKWQRTYYDIIYIFYIKCDITYITIRECSYSIIEYGKNYTREVSYNRQKRDKLIKRCDKIIEDIMRTY
jgi:hypothetical protein